MILIVDTVRRAGEHLQLNTTVVENLIQHDREVVFLTSSDYWKSFPKPLREKMLFESTVPLPSGLISTLRTLLLLVKIILFRRSYSHIIFLSSITYNSFFISIFSYLRLIKPKVFVFLHEVSYIESRQKSARLAGYFLKIALSIGLKKQGKFLIVGEYIKCELERRVKFNKKSTVFIEHPSSNTQYHQSQKLTKLIKFAAVGVQCDEKNSYKIESIADHNRDLVDSGALKLSTIGRLDYSYNGGVPVNHIGLKYDNYLIPIDDYTRFILDQHYLLFFLGKEYDLKTSGTILQAMECKKPIIALSCNLINFYFEKFGNIGHVYSCMDDMKKGIATLCINFDLELYNNQIYNLTKAKERLDKTFFCQFQQLLVNKG